MNLTWRGRRCNVSYLVAHRKALAFGVLAIPTQSLREPHCLALVMSHHLPKVSISATLHAHSTSIALVAYSPCFLCSLAFRLLRIHPLRHTTAKQPRSPLSSPLKLGRRSLTLDATSPPYRSMDLVELRYTRYSFVPPFWPYYLTYFSTFSLLVFGLHACTRSPCVPSCPFPFTPLSFILSLFHPLS